MFFEDYTEKLWGVHPSKISPEWGAQRVKGLSLVKAVLNVLKPKGAKRETSLIESFLYPKKSPGQLWKTLDHGVRRVAPTSDGDVASPSRGGDVGARRDARWTTP